MQGGKPLRDQSLERLAHRRMAHAELCRDFILFQRCAGGKSPLQIAPRRASAIISVLPIGLGLAAPSTDISSNLI
jgi:hypothetical protein